MITQWIEVSIELALEYGGTTLDYDCTVQLGCCSLSGQRTPEIPLICGADMENMFELFEREPSIQVNAFYLIRLLSCTLLPLLLLELHHLILTTIQYSRTIQYSYCVQSLKSETAFANHTKNS